MILIVGGGPRALAVALQCWLKGLEYRVYDRDALSTWRGNPAMVMRSPSTFDLVTFLPDCQEFSFRSWLGAPAKALTQLEVESCADRRTRGEFFQYLMSVVDRIGFSERVIRERVDRISRGAIWVRNRRIEGKVVLAPGTKAHIKKQPLNQDRRLEEKSHRVDGDSLLIIGSGQSAFEQAVSESTKRRVGLSIKQTPRIDWYPVPVMKDWGRRSALGDFFRTLPPHSRLEYLESVGSWQPSVMPPTFEAARPLIVHDANWEEWDSVRFLTGSVPDVSTLPFDWPITRDPQLPKLPNVRAGFKCDDVYFTGTLATGYDGPRQNSFISAGLTAREIVNDLLQHS